MFGGSTLEAAIEREQAEEKPLVLSIRQMLVIRSVAEYQSTVSERWEDWEAIMQRIDLVTGGPVYAAKLTLERAVKRLDGDPEDVAELVEDALDRDIAAEAAATERHGGDHG